MQDPQHLRTRRSEAVLRPACNKLVVLALGTSGALNIWAPLQPLIGIASIVLLAWALHVRLAGELSCPIPAPAQPD